MQAAEKTKKPPKVKAPDINDEEFPGLPGMAKPKVQEASEDSDAEKVNGTGEDGENGGGEGEAAESEKVGSRASIKDPQEVVVVVIAPLELRLNMLRFGDKMFDGCAWV